MPEELQTLSPEAEQPAESTPATPDSSPQSDQTQEGATDQVGTVDAPAEPTAPQDTAQPEKKASIPRERFEKFADKIRQEERERYEQQQANQPAPLPWNTPSYDDDPVTALQAEVRDLRNQIQVTTQQQQAQAEYDRFWSSNEADAKDIEDKFDHLNPNSASYDPEYAAEINAEFAENYQTQGVRAPRLIKLVERAEKLRKKGLEHGQKSTQATLRQQADEAALTPSSHASTEKPFSELSIAEMEARLGKVS